MYRAKVSAWLIGAAVCLIIHSVSSAPTLDCGRVISNGEHVGKIIGIIDKDGWTSPNYLFKPTGGEAGCVEFKGSEMRSKLLLTAYLTNALVKIHVKGNWQIGGIAFGN